MDDRHWLITIAHLKHFILRSPKNEPWMLGHISWKLSRSTLSVSLSSPKACWYLIIFTPYQAPTCKDGQSHQGFLIVICLESLGCYAINIIFLKDEIKVVSQTCVHKHDVYCTVFMLFVLRFYGPVNPMGSCRARSVYLTTCLLGRLSPLSGSPVLCTCFRQKLTTALLESAEGREWPQKIFHDQSPRKNVADLGGGWTRNLVVSSRTAHPTEPPRPAVFML